VKIIIPLILLLALAGCAPQDHQAMGGHSHENDATHFEPHYRESLFQITDNKLFSVEMLIKSGKLTVGSNMVDIIIHGQGNKDVEGAQVTVSPIMTEHGHGLLQEPSIIERGAGLYSVKGVDLMMEGAWELRIGISSNGVQDTTTFFFPDVQPAGDANMGGHTGHHMQEDMDEMSTEKLDFSTSRSSEWGMYKVSYTSVPVQIPLNTIHSWLINIATVDGNPVRGAKVQIRGGMPAHGHDLPTRPVMTGETAPGQYRVEGMKFNMPGHWTVTFDLTIGNLTDSATFNLQVR